jgi:DNA/RNA endonuclease YhcR with UshA esterase domain
MVLTIQPGICVIPDKATQSADSPGFYLASIDTTSESVTITDNTSGSTRTDSIYAVVDETPYTITNKELSSNVAIITTSTAHGFVGGQTVVVTGVDNTFDGSYVILTDAPNAPTTYTFRYTKTATNVASTAVVANATAADSDGTGTIRTATITKKKLDTNLATITTSAAHNFDQGTIVTVRGVDSVFDGSYEIAQVTTSPAHTFTYVKVARNVTETTISSSYSGSAVARVPFAIKVEAGAGSTLANKTKILLAKVSVVNLEASLEQTDITDFRQYVTGLGGVHIYDTNSSATGPAGVDGRLRWQTNSTGPTGGVRKLEVYDGADSAWVRVYDTATDHHDSVATDASTTAIHHTIGTSATQAAAGNHTHTQLSPSAWTAYTPVWTASSTNPGLGNATLTGHYAQIGSTVHFRIRLRAGSTTTFGTGSYRFTLPVEAVAVFSGAGEIIGQAAILDNSLGDRYVRHAYTFSSTICSLVDEAGVAVTNTVPFTWASLDNLSIVGTYEAA